MIREYEELLLLIKTKLRTIGYYLEDNNDYLATFSNETKWKITFEGDRYVRPSYTIWLEFGDELPNSRFALWLLIKTFEKRDGLSESTYSLEEELEWLVLNSRRIFIDPIHFVNDYEKLNTTEY